MGSRMMHYALGKTLADRLCTEDKEGFILGSILPDALPPDKKHDCNCHYITLFDDGRYKWFDSLQFYNEYEKEIKSDAIYLGYYFHLISDNVFRQIFYIDLGLIKRRGEKSLFQEFYRDYNILNRHIADFYHTEKDITVPDRLRDTALFKRFGFEPEVLIKDIYSDIDSHYEGDTMHFDMDIVRRFVDESSALCIKELEAVKNGAHAYDRYMMAIENHYSDKKTGETPDEKSNTVRP